MLKEKQYKSYISIHTLRVEDDNDFCSLFRRRVISIHTLRVEGDKANLRKSKCIQSISIHTLRVEGDLPVLQMICSKCLFQSTPSVWRVTQQLIDIVSYQPISIHTLRVEGDLQFFQVPHQHHYFNPHPPCGG